MSFLCAEWFTTAYARNTPLPLALCALDLFLVRLDDVMIRLGLAIMEVRSILCLERNGSRRVFMQVRNYRLVFHLVRSPLCFN